MSRFLAVSMWALLLVPVVSNRLLAEEPLTSGSSNAAAVMAQAVENAYRNAVDEYEKHERSVDSLERWSRRLLASNLLAAPNPEARRDAYRSHVSRMKQEYDVTSLLFRNGLRGGEADKEAGLRYYLADANLLLLRHSGDEKPAKELIEMEAKEAQNMK